MDLSLFDGMNIIDGPNNSLFERLWVYATTHGTRTGGESKSENDDISSRSTSWETYQIEADGHAVITTLRTKSGMGTKETKSYRLVSRSLQYLSANTDEDIIARHMVAEGNWYPNPYVSETAESSMALSRATGPAWILEDGGDGSVLEEVLRVLELRYDKKPA